MNKTQVMALLKANRNEQGIRKWKLNPSAGRLKSFGIGLTVLRKLAKQVGRDHVLAMKLWQSDVYDARVLALLIDDPKVITREQAEEQVEQLEHGYLAHVFSSCDATLAKSPLAVELVDDWILSDDPMRRCCGYGLLYEISKSKKKTAPGDEYFLEWIAHIRSSFASEQRSVNHALGVALMGIGARNKRLHAPALKLAREIGPLEIESLSGTCEPFDTAKHLTSDVVKRKVGL